MTSTVPQALRILLVEDQRSEAVYIETTLNQVATATRLVTARTISAALAILDEQDIDVVLLDLGLPDATGFSGLHAVQAAAPKVPVVMLTANEDRQMELSAMENGAQDYLLKDRASPSALSRAMSHAIQRKQVENLKSEFISVVSHELRTPLTSIHGSLGLINGALGENLPEQVMRLVDIAYKNSDRLIRLVSDILDIDKIDSGQLYFDVRLENLAPIVECAIEANYAFGVRYGVTYKLDPNSDDALVLIDSSRLSQVLANLLSNAAKFSPEGSDVEIAIRRERGRVRISVTDHGVGIRHEFRDRIFHKFSQSDSTITRRVGGAGLGLYISKQIIEHMDGNIGFDSVLGKGATFWIDMPDKTVEASRNQTKPERAAS